MSGEQQLGYTDGDDPIYAEGRPEWMEEPYRETSLEDGAVLVDCPRCDQPMLLGELWREMLDVGYEPPACPTCEPDEWVDGADVEISMMQRWALAE